MLHPSDETSQRSELGDSWSWWEFEVHPERHRPSLSKNQEQGRGAACYRKTFGAHTHVQSKQSKPETSLRMAVSSGSTLPI